MKSMSIPFNANVLLSFSYLQYLVTFVRSCLRDFCVPQAPAALLKAALICAGIVCLPPSSPSPAAEDSGGGGGAAATVAWPSLEEQLRRVFGSGGIRITSRSGLPQGSGMGTSSILAGERGAREKACLPVYAKPTANLFLNLKT